MTIDVTRGELVGGYYRISPFELVTGWVPGFEPPDLAAVPVLTSAREAFESIVLAALRKPPCVVAFSGGRDSSAILAVAAFLADREGLSPPIAATHDFVGDEWADESAWQEVVVKHLGVQDWVRICDRDAFDVLGSQAREALRRHGLLWPAMLNVFTPMAELASPGGTMLTGEGGDEVLGLQRMTGLNFAVTARPRPTAAVRALVAPAVTPRWRRRQKAYRQTVGTKSHPWLDGPTYSHYCRAIADDNANAPLRWDRAVVRHGRRRNIIAANANQAKLLAGTGVAVRQPFLDQSFLAAFAASGGMRGFLSRTSMMRMLFHDVLPDAVLKRETKGEFSAVAFGPATRRLMEAWEGEGLGELADAVDWRVLRDTALSERPLFGAQLLVQHVWLEAERARTSHA